MTADEWTFPEPDLRAAFDAVFGPTDWDQPRPFDAASAEYEPTERDHPRFADDIDAASYYYREEVSSA